MKTIATTKFKRPHPTAKAAQQKKTSAHLIGSLRDKIRITGDIITPSQKWNAQS